MPFKTTRVDVSREEIRKALDMAYGSYIEQEGKKSDNWADQNIGQLGDHIRHEVDEVMGNIRRGEIGFLLHNAMDVIELGAILLAKANQQLEQNGKAKEGSIPAGAVVVQRTPLDILKTRNAKARKGRAADSEASSG